jgi:hypothetical protein
VSRDRAHQEGWHWWRQSKTVPSESRICPVIMGRKGSRLTEQRLVPFQLPGNAYPMIVHVRFIGYPSAD